MNETKLKIRFFTIADYIEEEIWLREMHNEGWKLVKMVPPCFYKFEKCEPEDVIYRLDFKDNTENPDYMKIMDDFGWEYTGKCVGWLYFRKSASAAENENEGEIFSDNESRIEVIINVLKKRLLPIAVIFLLIIIPYTLHAITGIYSIGYKIFWALIFVLYVLLIFRTVIKFAKLKKSLKR